MSEEVLRREIDALRQKLIDASRVVDALVGGRDDKLARSAVASPAIVDAAYERVRRSEQLLAAIFEGSMDAMLLMDDEGRYVDANRAACEMFDLPKEKLLGQRLADLVASGFDVPSMRRTLIERGRLRGDFPLLRRDGSRRHLEYSAVANIVPGLHLHVLRDVTDRKTTEGALERSEFALERREAHFRALIEKSADLVALVSPQGKLLYVSPASRRLLGREPADVVGTDGFAFMHPDDVPAAADALAAIVADPTTSATTESRFLHADGSWRWVHQTATNLLGDPSVDAIVINVRDITDRKNAELALKTSEERLRRAQKMEAIGSLAGGVAHDFNNLLTVVLSYTELALDEVGREHAARDHMLEVRRAGERAVDLTRQLLAFSRQQVLQPRVLALNSTLGGMEKMLRRVLGEDVALALVLEPKLGRLFADPGQIEQVIMNLVVNARDAMPRGGHLGIETANVDLSDAKAAERCGVAPGQYVALRVVDDGVGMDAATRAKVFDPFFTTKALGKGTGLGLSTVIGIVQQSGGNALVESEPGRGTTFEILLPRNDLAADTQPPPAPLTDSLKGTETILVVEDEQQVRSLVRAILQRHGYTVLEAQNGGEAVMLSEQHAHIDLLLTDVVMPHLSGPRIAERLCAQRPEMKVIYMSGYSDDAMMHHGVLGPGIACLHKPLTPETLARKVREVLDGPPPSSSLDRHR